MRETFPITSPAARVGGLDWTGISLQLDAQGYAMLPGLLEADLVRGLVHCARQMHAGNRVAFPTSAKGRGECLYFDAGLPDVLQILLAALYRRLAGVANRWRETLGLDGRYPARPDDFVRLTCDAGPAHARSCMNHLGAGDAMPLQRHGEDQWTFPMQVIALLSEPGTDFTGGECVMTEQRPRMQSRAIVVPLGFGDAAVIATAARPFKGTNGPYRVSTRHGISLVRRGQRLGMALSFHDAREKLSDDIRL